METNTEKMRLAEATAGKAKWKFFGPYLSERQWGTVREDYSPGGTAWDYLPHGGFRSSDFILSHPGPIASFLARFNPKLTILPVRYAPQSRPIRECEIETFSRRLCSDDLSGRIGFLPFTHPERPAYPIPNGGGPVRP